MENTLKNIQEVGIASELTLGYTFGAFTEIGRTVWSK